MPVYAVPWNRKPFWRMLTMSISNLLSRPWLGCALLVLLLPALAFGAGSGKKYQKKPKPGEFNPANETVEMFEAIESGRIEVS